MLNIVLSLLIGVPALLISNVLSVFIAPIGLAIPFLSEKGRRYAVRFLIGAVAGIIFGTLTNYGFNTYALSFVYLFQVWVLSKDVIPSDPLAWHFRLAITVGFVAFKSLIEVLF